MRIYLTVHPFEIGLESPTEVRTEVAEVEDVESRKEALLAADCINLRSRQTASTPGNKREKSKKVWKLNSTQLSESDSTLKIRRSFV